MKHIHVENCLWDIMKNHSEQQRCVVCGETLKPGNIVIRMTDNTMMNLKMHIDCSLQFSDKIKQVLDVHGSKILYENL